MEGRGGEGKGEEGERRDKEVRGGIGRKRRMRAY